MLYYSSFSVQEQGVKGNWDYKLKAVYIIAILDFVFETAIKNKGYLKAEELFLPQIEEERRQKEEALLKQEDTQQKLTRMITKMLEKGFSIADIAEDLEMSEDKILAILKH